MLKHAQPYSLFQYVSTYCCPYNSKNMNCSMHVQIARPNHFQALLDQDITDLHLLQLSNSQSHES